MRTAFLNTIRRWGTRSRLNIAEYAWFLSMFGILALLEHDRIGLLLIPPFGATLTILIDIPETPVAQPYPLVVGSVVGASIGTLLNLFASGGLMAIVAAVSTFAIINLIHAYHPPGIALAMFPLLLHTGHWFPLTVVLPFTVTAAGSVALLSRLIQRWPTYPRSLRVRADLLLK
jgi:CBS domain-containing membrane protein